MIYHRLATTSLFAAGASSKRRFDQKSMQGAEVCVFESVDHIILEDLLQKEDRFMRLSGRKECMTLQYFLHGKHVRRTKYVVGCQCL
jgi:hypothetical protein